MSKKRTFNGFQASHQQEREPIFAQGTDPNSLGEDVPLLNSKGNKRIKLNSGGPNQNEVIGTEDNFMYFQKENTGGKNQDPTPARLLKFGNLQHPVSDKSSSLQNPFLQRPKGLMVRQ